MYKLEEIDIKGFDNFETVRSLVVFNFLRYYSKYELLLKQYFIKSIIKLDRNNINKLYFYLGGKTLITNINAKEQSLNIKSKKFNIDEKFESFNLASLLNIIKSEDKLNNYNLDIEAIKGRGTYKLYEKCKILINLRNFVAHNQIRCEFSNKHKQSDLLVAPIDKYEMCDDVLYKNLIDSETNVDPITLAIYAGCRLLISSIPLIEEAFKV